jgi:hypothetical protein
MLLTQNALLSGTSVQLAGLRYGNILAGLDNVAGLQKMIMTENNNRTWHWSMDTFPKVLVQAHETAQQP